MTVSQRVANARSTDPRLQIVLKSDTNLLILDEVLTTLDQQGTESVMQVLTEYKNITNKAIITINHLTDLNQEFFDYNYEVTIDKGFSKITGA